jgi:ribosomal protein S18 acetylase RimI-like enzyme
VTAFLEGVSEPAILEALDRHEREVSTTFARAVGGHVDDRPDRLVYVTGLPAEFANGVKSPRLSEASADEEIERSRELLEEAAVPGTWSVGPLATPPDLDRRLQRAGFTPDFDLRMMAGEIGAMDLEADDPKGLALRRVDGDQAHRDWLHVMEIGFGMPEGHTVTIDSTARAIGFDAEAPWVRFVGTVEGEPVASSGLMTFGGLAGIYNVATVPGARRRGYGEALTRAAIGYGRDLGYHVAILGASDLGRGIYQRMGFRDVCVARQFVFDPTSASSR